MAWLREMKRALHGIYQPKAPQPGRWPVTGFTALYGLQSPSTPAAVKDIGSDGSICVGIQESLAEGQLVALKLQKEGDPALRAELELRIQAQVSGRDESGVLLSLIPPAGLDAAEWGVLVRNLALSSDSEQVLELFRTLRTILFLCRICPSGAQEAILLLDGRLDQDRTAALFKIARESENLLAAGPDSGRMRAHPKLVANLLREGSWAHDELMIQMWVGLFASSCSVDVPDDFNQIFVDLLVQMTPSEASILTYACERAMSSVPAPGDSAPTPIVVSADEIVKLTGIYDQTRNATDLAYLYNLGLIQNVVDFTSYRGFEKFDITPSRLGLELYVRCHGRGGKIDPELETDAKEHLAVFNPPPIPSAFANFTPHVADSQNR